MPEEEGFDLDLDFFEPFVAELVVPERSLREEDGRAETDAEEVEGPALTFRPDRSLISRAIF